MPVNPDDYAFWRAALRGVEQTFHLNEPHLGYWAKPRKGQTRIPVAIWKQEPNGIIVARVGFAEKNYTVKSAEDLSELWTWVCRYPVQQSDYNLAYGTGAWPSDPPAEALDQPKEKPGPVSVPVDDAGDLADALATKTTPLVRTTVPPIGHNHPPEGDAAERETIEGQIAALKKAGIELGAVDSDDKAAKAQGLRSRLLEVGNGADKRREALKRPHLDAGKAIDNAWNPLVKSAQAIADALRKIMREWENEKARKEAEEAVRRERETREAAEAGKPAPAPVEAVPAPASSTIKPSYGRAASVQDIRVGRIVDQDKVYMAVRTNAEVIELLERLVKLSARAGLSIDGAEYTTEKDVK